MSSSVRLTPSVTPPAAPVPPAPRPSPGLRAALITNRYGRQDRFFRGLTRIAAAITLATMGAIVTFLVVQAWPAISAAGADFWTTQVWLPQADPPRFGIAAMLFGTVVSSVIAITVGVPIAIGVALAICYYLPQRVAAIVGGLVELLAAIPSLVFGMWGLYFVVPNTRGTQQWLSENLGWIPLFDHRSATVAGQYGKSLLVAGVVLAIMIIPIVAALCREIFARTPVGAVEAALGLGATRREVIATAVMPMALPGVVAAALLGLGRALGETIAMALMLGSGFAINWHLTEPGGDTIASTIVLKFGEAGSDPLGIPALILAGLVLFVITLVVNVGARIVLNRKVVTS